MMKREFISKIFQEEKNKLEGENKKLKDEYYRQKIMKDIELKTNKIVVSNLTYGEILNPIIKKDTAKIETTEKKLQTILSGGANEFKEKMGRNMTYSEMREMFG
jgi:hypothetical protein